jgi:hypothetical protein
MEEMDSGIKTHLLHHWPRKIVALVTAIVIWLFVNATITESKTIPNVPIRIINLPPHKTIVGLLPNHLLSKRLTLTLSGSKDVIREIEPGDLEIVLDVSTADNDEWVARITKKNLVSLNPSIDLVHHITEVSYADFMLKLSPLVTLAVPIHILLPKGEPPSGYEFLDIWPQKLVQVISGAEEELRQIESTGLELVFNLSDISKTELDALKSPKGTYHDDEVSFYIPVKWKKVSIPCHQNALEEINDPEAQHLRIDFLRKVYIPIGKEMPIRVFYPLKNRETLNETSFPLEVNQWIRRKNDLYRLTMPLYTYNVSRLFVEIINEFLEINIIAAPKLEREWLSWSVEVIDAHNLEDIYVAYLMTNIKGSPGSSKRQETMLRKRFREYIQRLTLYSSPDHRFHMESFLGQNTIEVKVAK